MAEFSTGAADVPPDLCRALAQLADAIAAGPALLVPERVAAKLCGVGVTTFRRRVAAGVLPRQVALSDGLALWRRADIERAVRRLKGRDETKRAKTRRAKAGTS